jgi:hypothetical protein
MRTIRVDRSWQMPLSRPDPANEMVHHPIASSALSAGTT